MLLTKEATEPMVPSGKIEVNTSKVYNTVITYLTFTECLCHIWPRICFLVVVIFMSFSCLSDF